MMLAKASWRVSLAPLAHRPWFCRCTFRPPPVVASAHLRTQVLACDASMSAQRMGKPVRLRRVYVISTVNSSSTVGGGWLNSASGKYGPHRALFQRRWMNRRGWVLLAPAAESPLVARCCVHLRTQLLACGASTAATGAHTCLDAARPQLASVSANLQREFKIRKGLFLILAEASFCFASVRLRRGCVLLTMHRNASTIGGGASKSASGRYETQGLCLRCG
jgi:hypothetical protein